MVYLIKFFQVVAILFLAFFWNKFLLEKVFLILTKTYTKNSNDTFIPFFSIKDEKTKAKKTALLQNFINEKFEDVLTHDQYKLYIKSMSR